jgi:uncharacterized protein YdhG (YjbR/CyaY superfamily)
MKKVKSTASAGKPKKTPKKFDEYCTTVPQPALVTLKKLRAAIRSALPPEATEVISYRIPAFKQKRVLLWYAAFSKHCSLFPTAAVIEEFQPDLKGFSTSKGTVHFPLDKPLPTALIRKMVKARVAQQQGKARR